MRAPPSPLAAAATSHLRCRRVPGFGVALLLLLAHLSAGCARPGDELLERPVKNVMTPDELRREVVARVPELAPESVLVLFEVDPDIVERVRVGIGTVDLDLERVRRVVRLITSEAGLGLQYDRENLGTAAETIERGSGNCLSLAAVLVGVSRGLGWDAVFVEMSLREDELLYEADVAIAEEHMGAKIKAGSATLYIDYSGRMSIRSRVQAISDLRATAQLYSNQAYELLHDSHREGAPIPWAEIARRFEIATRIEPDLAQAWNNLGVARSRIGDVEGAAEAYQQAISLSARMQSAERNLRLLQGLPPEPTDAGRPGVPAGWEPVVPEP